MTCQYCKKLILWPLTVGWPISRGDRNLLQKIPRNYYITREFSATNIIISGHGDML